MSSYEASGKKYFQLYFVSFVRHLIIGSFFRISSKKNDTRFVLGFLRDFCLLHFLVLSENY